MRFLFLSIFTFITLNSQAQYFLYWNDEFEQAEINSANWTHEIGASGWGNNELQYYTNSPSNSFIENGLLKIRAKNEPIFNSQYSSARMISKGKFEFRYGRIEARIKVPMGQGLWPAFWLLGANISQVSWPACGEVDIMEHIGNEYQNYGTFHFDSLGHRYHGGSYGLDPTLFHQYAFVWTPTTMTWLVDNNPYYSVNITNGIGNKEEFHLPFFILLNIAVGGNWPGSPSTSTIFPAEMQIDYIRVYKDNSELDLAENQESLVNISPNPAGTTIKVQSLNSAIIKDITITSSSGQTIGTRAINLLGEIDVADLLPGLYFITCIDESDRPYSTRFIKE